MADRSKIEWTDATWNPVRGCTKISPGCKHCYAERMSTGLSCGEPKFLSLEPLLGPLSRLNLRGIDWVIVGGESGPGARPMNPEWVRDIRDQCGRADVTFFFKSWGGPFKSRTGRALDGRTWIRCRRTTSPPSIRFRSWPPRRSRPLPVNRFTVDTWRASSR